MRRAAHWTVPALVALAAFLVQAGGEPLRGRLRFDRNAVADGEIWRLLTGHFAHLGFAHLLLNVAALLLIWLLAGRDWSLPAWLLVMAVSIAGIDLGLWYLDPELYWYVGLSGLLHGMLAAGLVGRMRTAPVEALLLAVLLTLKIAYEQVSGPLPGSEASAGGAVVVNSHLYGALAGALAAAALRIGVRERLPI